MRYPRLTKTSLMAIDIETYDPELIKKGPGVYRNDGYILGVSIATDTGFSEYYNIGHYDCTEEEKNKNITYLRDIFNLPCSKVGANFMYDLDWLCNWKYQFKIEGKYHDVQIAEPLLDSYRRSYSLDSLSSKYLGKEKYKDEIKEFCEKEGLKGDPRKWLYKMPYSLVRRYAIVDAEETIEVFKKQQILLEQQNLIDLYNIESENMRVLLMMRKNGTPIDINKKDHTINELTINVDKIKKRIVNKYGTFNINSGPQIAAQLDLMGIEYPKTDKGNPCLDKNSLRTIGNELTLSILEARATEKALTYFKNSIDDKLINGRLHCQFNPLKSDNKGTVTGRFSSSSPNLQQVSAPREKGDFGFKMRDIFIPEDGQLWGKIDYSQIEYRVISHFAVGPRSEEVRQEYINDPTTDYHALVMSWTGLDRKRAKNMNFGSAYFMGARSCSELFGWTYEEAKNLLDMYHETVPFVKTTGNKVITTAKRRDAIARMHGDYGHIKTILGRRARVSDFIRQYGAHYKLFNYLIQGSAADIMKKAMHDAYYAGVFNVLTLHLTVHDELDFSFPNTKEGIDAYRELKKIMEECVTLKVPVIADAEAGPSWARIKEFSFND